MLKKIALFVTLLAVSVTSVSQKPTNADFNRQALREDTMKIGYCQAVMTAVLVRTRLTVNAMEELEADPGPEVYTELKNLAQSMKNNHTTFRYLFREEILPKAAALGLNEIELVELRASTERDSLATLRKPILATKEQTEKAALTWTFTLDKPMFKCVDWHNTYVKRITL